jgi:hypothetical protein
MPTGQLNRPVQSASSIGKFAGLDDVATIRLRDRRSTNKQIMDLAVDEVAVALQVLMIDVEFRRNPEEPLEMRDLQV